MEKRERKKKPSKHKKKKKEGAIKKEKKRGRKVGEGVHFPKTSIPFSRSEITRKIFFYTI